MQSLILFDNISKGEKFRITWNDFLDFLIENLEPQTTEKLWLTLMQIEPSPQTKVSIHHTIIDTTNFNTLERHHSKNSTN